MGCGDQFGLLLWKNYILQKRRPIATLFEVLLPIVFAVLLIIIRVNVDLEKFPNSTIFEEFKVDRLPGFSTDVLPDDQIWTIAYVPSNITALDKVMLATQARLNKNTSSEAGGMPTDPLSACNFSSIPTPNTTFLANSSLSPQAINATLIATAEAIYRNLPTPVQQIMGGMARGRNTTAVELLYGVLRNNEWTSFMANLSALCRETVLNTLGISEEDLKRLSNLSESEEIRGFLSKIVPKVNLMSFDSEEDFLLFVKNDTNLKHVLAGVIFDGFDPGTEKLTDKLKITLRFHSDPVTKSATSGSVFSGIADTWQTNQLFPAFQRPGPRSNGSNTGGRPYYYNEGFLSLMHAVHMAIASVLTNSTEDQATFALKRYPYPPYINDTFIIAIQNTLPLVIMLSFFYTSLIIVRSIVQEKESRMKEYMMMMGLSNWLHWTAWFVKYLVFIVFSCALMTGIYKIKTERGSVITNSDASVIFVFLVLFAAATINLSFLISAFFSKANVGAAAGGIIYALTYMPYLFMANNYSSLSRTVKFFSSLLSNVAMAGGWNMVGLFEGKGTGVQWSNIHEGVTVDDNFTLLDIFGMLIFDAILYLLLTIYIEGVWPGDYGIPKPWYFPFTKSYWLGRKVVGSEYSLIEDTETQDNELLIAENDEEYFEEEPSNLKRTVEIKGLRKVFKSGGKRKVAVNNLSLNMYDGQITVLLGHNGAGKTTTMSMLTGFFPPTSGDAFVDGHSITKDIAGVRKALGLCPQFNILFDLLTVNEHLYFFGRLKGLTKAEAIAECQEMTKVLKLTDKCDRKSHTLSGGMKRKLSVGLALCAGSKHVIMDEPTSGMDPSARRAIWEVLQCYRSKCSMLLSTHFMDEADLLGDRIAIMADGKVRCVGSSVFLKNAFGVGYHIVLTKSSDCDVNRLTGLIRSFVPETNLERSAGAELSFVLPFQASPQFPGLFQALDEESSSLGISGYGAMVTTLEEVFLRVTEDAQEAVKSVSRKWSMNKSALLRQTVADEGFEDGLTASNGHASNGLVQTAPLNAEKEYLYTSLRLNTGVTLWVQQFYGLLVKKILHSRRNYKVALAQLIVPVFFAVLAILNAKFPPFERQNVPLNLALDAYGPNNVYVDNPVGYDFGEIYRKQFIGSMEQSNEHDGDLDEFLSDKYYNEGGQFNSENLVSASFGNSSSNKSHATAWFNNQAYHTPATSLLYVHQAYLRHVTKRNFSLQVINFPLPRNTTNRVQEQLLGSLSGFLMAFNIVLGFSFLAASFCLFLVRERVERSALLQTLAGVDPVSFWLSAFTWDFINFMTPCFLTLAMFAIFSIPEFTNHSGVVLLLFSLYCWAALPFMYLLSFLFTVPSTALVRVTILNVITGLASIITINVLRLLELTDVADGLNWFFLFMPPYCLGMGLADVYANDKMVNICTTSEFMELFCRSQGITFQENFMAWEQYGVGKFVAFLAIQGVVCFVILFFFEFNVYTFIFRLPIFAKNASVQASVEETVYDDEVAAESARINSTEMAHLVSSNRLIIKNLRKVYGSGSKALVAVHHLSIGIPEGECFGLLGINGAGKTTTFKMITGDYNSTSGTAYLDGYDVKTHLRQAQQRMGYCPQFDALIEQMTGSETLRMFARLRGVPESDIFACVENLGKILHFSEHLDKECGKYSGGNKRKLSTAIALVGNPPVVLLDEPSTGMDPGARRMLWDALTSVRASGRSLVITSHSMEECEALCTRLSIMVNGTLRCIGGPQHLKSKFGQGYTVEVKANGADVKAFMKEYLPGCELKDEHQGLLTFHVPQYRKDAPELKLAMVFQSMENAKQNLSFGDYTVTQTTLEQVFLQLVRRQIEAGAEANTSSA